MTAPAVVRGTFTGWRGVAAAGCAIAIAIVVAVNVSAGTVIVPLVAVAIVFAAAGLLIGALPGRLGAVVALAAAGVFLVPTVRAFPESFAWSNDPLEFTAAAAAVVALSLVVAGGVAMVIRGARTLAVPDTNAPRSLVVLGLLLVCAALVTSVALRMTVENAEAAEGDVVVPVDGFAFPDTVRARPGDIRLVLDNGDRGAHTLTIDELGVDLVVPGHAAGSVTTTAEAGSYDIRCRIPGHSFMDSTLIVR